MPEPEDKFEVTKRKENKVPFALRIPHLYQ